MKKEKKQPVSTAGKQLKSELRRTVVFALSALLTFTAVTVAWFANNADVASAGLAVDSDDPNYIHIMSDVTAVRSYLSDKKDLTVTFEHGSDGILSKKSSSAVATDSAKAAVLFGSMLPGEYVDITFRVKMDEPMDGKDYYLYLADFGIGEKPTSEEDAISSAGWFSINEKETVDGETIEKPYYYNILGVYKYQVINVHVEDADGNALTENLAEAETEKFLSSYTARADSEVAPNEIIMFGETWEKEIAGTQANDICVTIRIESDFTQFYNLLKETGSNISNLLSQKGFVLGTIGVRSGE